jgi:non-lysosomal glucosylceramidase
MKGSPHGIPASLCSNRQCGCGTPERQGLARRAFLKSTALAAAGIGLSRRMAVAGPFTLADFEQLVPADKKLNPDWVKSLFERGEPQVWRGSELAYIGMPVGGIGCGQLYLGGDGQLWYWQIYKPNYSTNYANVTTGPHYAKPLHPGSPIENGFALKLQGGAESQIRELNGRGFSEISFRGEYPMGRVQYRDPACPVQVDLEAFSPFIPLDAESSALPVTVLHYTILNTSAGKAEIEIAGWLQNAVCLEDDQPDLGRRTNRITQRAGALVLECSAEPPPARSVQARRPDFVFEDFEKPTYADWVATGTAFGPGPIEKSKMPPYQGDVGAEGQRLVNTHNARHGEDVEQADAHVGTLTSRPFTIERNFISFLIGGGHHPGKTCLNLLLDGKVAASATGHNDNRMRRDCFDVSALIGRTAQLQIVDQVRGAWGNIGIDQIVFTDEVPSNKRLDQLPGYGTMALSLLQTSPSDLGAATVHAENNAAPVFKALQANPPTRSATEPFGRKLVGALGRKLELPAGGSATVTFLVSWHFAGYPNPTGELAAIQNLAHLRRHYAKQFASAAEVSDHVAGELEILAAQTRHWNQTWYDSTLPYWFLDRTFIPIDTLATTTCHWFDSGRFYGWEGVDCCPGTCQHVWHYAQAMARIFPQFERDLRERVDFGLAWHENGAMDYRAESGRNVAHDGFAGTILRVYREHQMSGDDAFLKRLWPRVKKSIEYLIAQDKDDNGLLEGEQYNTLDAAWYGPMAWISSLYLGALQAGRAMALEVGDEAFARRCEGILEAGRKNIVAQLFNGEYFIQKPDPHHPEAINTNDGCHIDQVFGQNYVWQLGLPRVVPQTETESALRSLWRYNFTPDIGPYRKNFKAIKSGRWYAMPGEGGLLMCTWPRGGAEKAPGRGDSTFVGYFNECMTGFEYQVAAHLVWEGMAMEGLAIVRTIHDRYHASKRNPYNEVECSDHYSRAMMSYGVFLAACGFEYHGPKGHIGFAPRLTPENFRAPFTAAEGWGTFAQRRDGATQTESIEVKWGQLRLRTLAFAVPAGTTPAKADLFHAGQPLQAKLTSQGGRVEITLPADIVVRAGQRLEISIGLA